VRDVFDEDSLTGLGVQISISFQPYFFPKVVMGNKWGLLQELSAAVKGYHQASKDWH
jgi:hypothetical protein